MRITTLSLVAVLFMAISGYSTAGDNSELKLKSNENILKIPKNPCDLCGCYMGLDLESRSQAGIRYRLRTFRNEAHSNHTENSTTDHSGHTESSSNSIETYNTFELYAKYYVTKALQVSLTLPYSNNNIDGGNYKGAGDMTAIVKYNLLKNNDSRNSISKLYIGAGVKLPTGRFRLPSSDGTVEPHFQSGTGSTDFIFSGSFYASNGKLGIDLDNVLRLNTANRDKYHFANRLNTAMSVFYNITPSALVNLIPIFGFYLETAGNDTSKDETVTDSGGTVMFLSAGGNIKLNRVTLAIDIQKPVFEDLNGNQISNDIRLSVSTGYIF